MAIIDRFLKEAHIGLQLDLVAGPKEISGVIVSLDEEIVQVKKADDKIATIDLTAITFYEIHDKALDLISVPVSTEALREPTLVINNETQKFNVLELAIKDRNIDVIMELLQNKELLYTLGYSDTLIERMLKVVEHSIPKGEDFYSIASRFASMQDNINGWAEEFFLKSLSEIETSEIIKQKSVRKLQSIYSLAANYYNYYYLVDKYFDYLNLSNASLFIFHIEAMKNKEDLVFNTQTLPVNFNNENDYISFFSYLLNTPDNYLAEKAIFSFIKKFKNIQLFELAIMYANKFLTKDLFENLRIEMFVNLYPTYTIEELKTFLSIGYEYEDTNKIDEIINQLLNDHSFGVVKAFLYAKENEIESDVLSDKIKQIEYDAENEWKRAVDAQDDIKKIYLLNFYELIGIDIGILDRIRAFLKRYKEEEIFKALERYDALKIKAIVTDVSGMKQFGYTENEIEKFANILTKGCFPQGASDYEVASRLNTWGLTSFAVNYYIKVANNTQNDKRKNAINQLIGYAIHTKDIKLFEKYYLLLDDKQKKNESYLRFLNECKFSHEQYQELYNFYLSDKTITQPSVIYGALRFKDNSEVRNELIDKACQIENFNYDFWLAFLKDILIDDREEYLKIVYKLFNSYTLNFTSDLHKCYEIICLDSEFDPNITNELIIHYTNDEYPLPLSLLLCEIYDETHESTKKYIREHIVKKLNKSIEEMEYKYAFQIGTFAEKYYVNDEELSSIVRIASNGMDVYNMLPSGHDNYAKGKRLLMLGENIEKAFECFKSEIEYSDDKKNIALCGMELLKGLFETENYEDVISWGRKLILEKDIVEYSSLVLDLNNAFDILNDSDAKFKFIKNLESKVELSIQIREYDIAVSQIKLLEIFDKDNIYAVKYKDLLEKVKSEAITLDEESYLGKANIIKYVIKDETQYISFIKEGFENGQIEANNKTTVATLLLETIIANNSVLQNMDFINSISSYGIVLSEHIIDMLYSIVLENKNINDAIEYFSNLLNVTDSEKRITILIRLEKIYENALMNHCPFEAKYAVNQMFEYTQKNSSLQVRLCYIWLLAYLGDIERAGELLSLIPDDENFSNEHNLIIDTIVDEYFDGQKPILSNKFEALVKDNTLYRLVEHCKQYKDFISFSLQEEKIYSELIKKNSSYKIDPLSETTKSAVIKSIYTNPTKYKLWYIYYLCVKNYNDDIINYCVLTNLAILNSDVTNNSLLKSANHLIRNNEEITKRYSGYKLYNHLYRLYILKAYQKDISVIKQITNFSLDKKAFSPNSEYKIKMAEDYIHLLKLLDDRDDYIYIKSAMFIATNNKCEEYFYSLFKNDLLYRESALCVKMCLGMIMNKKRNIELCKKILTDLKTVSTEHLGVINLLMSDIEYVKPVCLLLKDYPSLPSASFLTEVLKNYNPDIEAAISILESVDSCYSDAIEIKKMLLNLYKKSGKRDYYENMYQIIVYILRTDTLSEKVLIKHCEMSALLAIALGKNNRTADIINIYDRQSLNGEHSKELIEFCEVCEAYDIAVSEQDALLFDVLITDKWSVLFEKYGLGFVENHKNVNKLLASSKMNFVQGIFSYMIVLENSNEKDKLNDFQNNAELTIKSIYGKSVFYIIFKMFCMTKDEQKSFISCMDIENFDNPFVNLPENESVIKNLLLLWEIVYGENYLINLIVNNKSKTSGYEILCRMAIGYFENKQLLSCYIESLFDSKKYSSIISLTEVYKWGCKELFFVTYYCVSLLLEDNSAALEYLSKVSTEEFICVILLLKKNLLNEEIQKVTAISSNNRNIINLIFSIVDSPSDEMFKEIDDNYKDDTKIALLKLFYSCCGNIETKSIIYNKFGEIITDNIYIPFLPIDEHEKRKKYFFEASHEGKSEVASVHNKCNYLEEALKELSFENYNFNILSTEFNTIDDLYLSLGLDYSENTEYRKELLLKLVYISKEQKDMSKFNDYLIKLGVVMYYSNFSSNIEKSRKILFEAVKFIKNDTKHSTVEIVRETLCKALNSYETVDEIVFEKIEIIKTLDYIIKNIKAKDFSVFFQKMIEYSEQISEILAINDIFQRTGSFGKLSNYLKTSIAKSTSTPLFGQVYTKWYRIIQTEIKKLSNGAVLNLEIETLQCSPRGKICCIIQNMGKKPAENISIRAIFEDTVRCKDHEKEIKILYGGDTTVFAFNIRSKEEGVQKYKIELTYEISQNIEHMEYSKEIRIVRENEYEHIGNLYSVAPVMSNAEFYGREREKEEILGFLNDIKYNTSMVMYGLKRVGKTSMLRFVERTMRDSDNYIPVYKSAQGIGEQNAIGKMFVKTIIDELENLGIADDKCRSYLEYDYDKNPEQLYDFYMYLQKSEIMGKKRILFMADEIEEIFDMVNEGFINRRLYKVLRVILQELVSIRFIFCGADYLTDILYNHALADIFEITKRFIISRLDEDSMQRMIVEPATDKLSYTDRAIERIWYYTNGHTFYSKHICSKVIDILNEESRITAYAYDIDSAVKQVMRVTEYFIYLSRFFSDEDKQVIKIICDNTKFAKDRVSEDVLENNYEGRDLYESLTALEFKDILEKKEIRDTDYYNFSIEMFRLWYSKAEYVIESGKGEN